MDNGNIIYSVTTAVAIDEYTSERINRVSRENLGFVENIKLGVSSVRPFSKRVKYKDTNYMP